MEVITVLMKKKSHLFLMLLIMVFPSFSTCAQAPPVVMQAYVGFGDDGGGKLGLCKLGGWAPLAIELLNQSESNLAGVLTVEVGCGSNRTQHRLPLDLGKKSTKRVRLEVFLAGGAPKLLASFGPEGGRPWCSWESAVLDLIPATTTLVVSAGRPLGLPPQTLTNKHTLDQRYTYRNALPWTLPEHRLGYQAVNALVWNSGGFNNLDTLQQEAVRDWVRGGGQFVVTLGADADQLRGTAMDAFIPAAGDHHRTGALTGVGNFVGAGSDPPGEYALASPQGWTEAEALIHSPAGPLAWRRQVGNGTVTVLAFDTKSPDWQAWSGQQAFWEKLLSLLSEAPLKPGKDDQSSIDTEQAGHPFAQILAQQMKPSVSLWNFVLFVLVYIIVVGPVDYLVVRWLGKPILTWVTFTGTVMVFSLLAYQFVLKMNAGPMTMRNVRLITQDHGSDTGRVTLYSTVMSQQSAHYQMQWRQPNARCALLDVDRSETPLFGGQCQVNYTRDHARLQTYIPIWTCRTVAADWLQTTAAPFRCEVSQTTLGLRAKYFNPFKTPLRHPWLVTCAEAYQLNDFAPGEGEAHQERSPEDLLNWCKLIHELFFYGNVSASRQVNLYPLYVFERVRQSALRAKSKADNTHGRSWNTPWPEHLLAHELDLSLRAGPRQGILLAELDPPADRQPEVLDRQPECNELTFFRAVAPLPDGLRELPPIPPQAEAETTSTPEEE